MKKLNARIIVAASLAMAAQQSFALEEFFTMPGARAMGMGGAFTAVASDSSTIWYNPAGLGFLPDGVMDVTIDYGTVVVGNDKLFDGNPDVIELYDTDQELKYLGFSGKGFGVAYFRPYDFYSFAKDDNNNAVFVRTEYQELKFGFGYPINDNISLGATIDMILQNTESDCQSCEDSDDETGFGYTLGALGKWTIHEQSQTEFRAGATFRSATDVDIILGDFDDLPNRPQVLSLGMALKRPFMINDWAVYATGSIQLDKIEYDDVLYLGQDGINRADDPLSVDHERRAFGAELQFITPSNQSVFVRLGTYKSESDGDAAPLMDGSNDNFRPYSEGVEAKTFGLGLFVGDWVVDYAFEDRKILEPDYNDVEDQKEKLHSFSVSRLF